jgi:hypothetical protein
MTIYSSTTNNITVYSGLSTDVKPTSGVMPGSMFIETNTLKQFTYSATAGWVAYYTKTGLLDGSGSPIGSSGGALYTAAFIWQPSSLSYIHASADASGNLNVTGGGGGGMVYPSAGIANSTGTAWDTSYSTTGSGTVVALATSPTFVTPLLGTPTSGNLANCTGYTYANLAGTVPTWNQNTTGTAANITATSNSTLTTLSSLSLPGSQVSGNISGNSANVTGTVAISNGGTGQTTASAAFNALSPITTTGDLILGNGTNSATRLGIGTSSYVLTSNGTTASWAAATGVLAKSTTVYTSGSGTYTAPANTQWVKITVVGPGGPGGSGLSRRGSGGGAGGVAIKWVAMTAGQTLLYQLGTPQTFDSTVSSGTLSISTITGGYALPGSSATYAASATVGGVGGAASGGDINITGGQGGAAYGASTSVTTNMSGAGGNCPGFGSGGSVVGGAIANGLDASGYGGGGGGAVGSTTAGNGAGGIIIFEAF